MNFIDKFRDGQLESSEAMVNSTREKMVLQAPTGSGKSVMVRVPGIVMDQRTLILTRTIELQYQYEKQGVDAMFGRSNYICTLEPMLSAAEGICRLGEGCPFIKDGCTYFGDKAIALDARTSVLNYAYFFRDGTFTDYDWVMCDEGHAVPNELASAFEMHFSTRIIRHLGLEPPDTLDSIDTWKEWGQRTQTKLKRKARIILRDKASMLHGVAHAIQRLEYISTLDNWVIESDNATATIRPIWPMDLAEVGLFSKGHKFVFTSATIDPVFTMRMLGVDPNTIDVVKLESQFPIENRPIYTELAEYYPRHYASESEYERLVRAIDDIIGEYPNKRGLIHTANYALAERIARESRNVNRLIPHTKDTRAVALGMFRQSEGGVLISPSMAEGVDLPYDQCEFIVVAKMPYSNIKSAVWQARFQSDPTLAQFAYSSEAISLIVQACGRGVRAKDDHCDTYILDHAFMNELDRNNNLFPNWFLDAIHR